MPEGSPSSVPTEIFLPPVGQSLVDASVTETKELKPLMPFTKTFKILAVNLFYQQF